MNCFASWSAVRPGTALLLILPVVLFVAGCASSRPAVSDEDAAVLEWPGPPQAPVIRWLDEIHDAHQAGIKPGFWNRIGQLVFGKRRERIVKPYGVHFSAAGQLYVTDPGIAGVHLFDIGSGRYTVISGAGEESLASPIGITGDDESLAYFTDSTAAVVYRYDPRRGEITPLIATGLQRPTGVVFNKNNWLLYVSDTAAHQVVVFGLDGQEKFRFGGRGTEAGRFNFPTDLFIDNEGRLVVTDSMNARVQIFTPDGRPLNSFGRRGYAAGYLDKPKGVAVDSDGHIYVCDTMKDAVQVYDADGRYLFQFGTRGQGAGQFWMPAGIHIDPKDKIYVADSYNKRIQVFQYMKP
jgi:DNA-binding beta-propeller fold protein YncE